MFVEFSGQQQLPELVSGLCGLCGLCGSYVSEERAVKSFLAVPQSIEIENCYAIRRTEGRQL